MNGTIPYAVFLAVFLLLPAMAQSQASNNAATNQPLSQSLQTNLPPPEAVDTNLLAPLPTLPTNQFPIAPAPLTAPFQSTVANFGAPASAGAALANKSRGRFSVAIQGDGDLMYAPGILWTTAHHNIPLMYVMHNNRGYHQEVMLVQRLSNQRNRVANNGKDFGPVGTKIQNPDIDYAKLADSMGVWSTGPIKDPKDLGPALQKAVQVVKAGEPAMVDVVTQPR